MSENETLKRYNEALVLLRLASIQLTDQHLLAMIDKFLEEIKK